MFRPSRDITGSHRNRPFPRRALVLFLAALATVTAMTPGNANAETRVDLTPSVAYFSAATNAIDEEGATAKFASGLGFGGRLSIWLNESVALEATGHYADSSLDGQIYDDPVGSIGASLFYGSAQIAVGLGAEKRFLLHGGLGFQSTSYDEFIESGTIMTGVLGISGWMPLSDSVALRADFDTHIHTLYYEVGDFQTEELAQFDMFVSVGLQFSPGGR